MTPQSRVYVLLLAILALLIFYKLYSEAPKRKDEKKETSLPLNQQTKEFLENLIKSSIIEALPQNIFEGGSKPPPKDDFSVGERGFWQGLDATKKHVFDTSLANSLLQFFQNESATSILELGAGTGNYAKLFKEHGFFIHCYDGNPNTQDLSEGRCGVIDLSKKLDFCTHDWLLSLEVGEHIPAQFEEIFISNLHNGNDKGLILSWAIEGQGGTSHVNNHNNDYIRNKFQALGYESDEETERVLRSAAHMQWFKNTIMVFRKI